MLAPQGASWSLCSGARAKCAPPFPEHHPGWGPCSGAHLKQCTRLCRSRQLCQFVFRNSACWFSALQAHGAAIGGTFWPAWPTHCTLHQWAGSAAHRLSSVAVVPIFAYSTAQELSSPHVHDHQCDYCDHHDYCTTNHPPPCTDMEAVTTQVHACVIATPTSVQGGGWLVVQ